MAPHTIAVAGKGGVGKTTTCGMIIDYLCAKKRGPVLVVDADANSNLNEVLGVEVETSLGQIREEMAQAELKGTIPKGMTKADYAEMKFGDALIEDDDFDMLVMGRTQGKGCYCYVNGVLQSQLGKYLPNYSYVVMDNEAGLEHIARGTLPHVDTMLLISDCSRRGVQGRGENRRNDRRDGLKPRTDGSDHQPRAGRKAGRRRPCRDRKARSQALRRSASRRGGLPLRLRRQSVRETPGQRPHEGRAAGNYAVYRPVSR